jgi:hypothetical protein
MSYAITTMAGAVRADNGIITQILLLKHGTGGMQKDDG